MLAITASEDCLGKFEEMRLGKKIAYQIYKIDGGKVELDIECEKSGKEKECQNNDAEKFIAAIKEKGKFIFIFIYIISIFINNT